MADELLPVGQSGYKKRLKDESDGSVAEVVALGASESHVGAVGGHTVRVTATVTRPADTTAYAAGDAMTDSTSAPTAITFANCARASGGSGILVGALMVDSANQATKLSAELWVFTASPTPDNDNAVFTPTDAECANLIAVIPLQTVYVGDATSGAGGNAVLVADPVNRPFVCPATSLYGLLVARNAYTPVSGEIFTIVLTIIQD